MMGQQKALYFRKSKSNTRGGIVLKRQIPGPILTDALAMAEPRIVATIVVTQSGPNCWRDICVGLELTVAG